MGVVGSYSLKPPELAVGPMLNPENPNLMAVYFRV